MNSAVRDTLALTFASFFPLVMALVYFVVLDRPAGEAGYAVMIAYMLGKVVQFGFPAAYVWWFERAQIRFAWPTARGLTLGAGFGLLIAMLMFALYYGWLRHVPAFAEKLPAAIHQKLQQFQRDTPFGYLQMALFFCIPHSLSEEYYWRWFVFGWMRRHVPTPVAILLSSIGFMLHHIVILGAFFSGYFWTRALPLALSVAVGGGFWAWLYQRSQSLYAPWLSHAIMDAAIMALGYELLYRDWQ